MFRAELGIDLGDQFQQLHRLLLDGSVPTATAVVADPPYPS